MRIGLLTGGGNTAGINTVVRAVVKTAIAHYGSEIVGIMNGFEGLLRPPQVRSLGLKDVSGFIRRSGTILGQAPRGNPFAYDAEGQPADRSGELLESFRWLGLDALICLGGLGSLAMAERISAQGIPIIAIPKSTTNELAASEFCVGYDTAVSTAVEVIDRLQSVEETEHRVLYVQVMGRDAGWTALMAGIAGGAHVVLVPEIPYSLAVVERAIEARRVQGRGSTLIVVAAGAQPPSGDGEQGEALDAVRRLAPQIHAKNGLDYDVTTLGPVQRGGEPSPRDRALATRLGAAAVQAAHDGLAGHLVALRGDRILTIPLGEKTRAMRLVSRDQPLVWSAVSQGISLGIDFGELPGLESGNGG